MPKSADAFDRCVAVFQVKEAQEFLRSHEIQTNIFVKTKTDSGRPLTDKASTRPVLMICVVTSTVLQITSTAHRNQCRNRSLQDMLKLLTKYFMPFPENI